MDAAGLGVDQQRQRVEVGVLELGQLAPALDLLDDRVLVADLGEHAGVGGEPGLAAALLRQPELVEEDLAELLRRADRELAPGELEDLGLQRLDLLLHPVADLGQALDIELEADALHRREHLDQRHLDLVHHPLDAELLQPRALALGELPGEAGVDRGIAGDVPLVALERELAVLGRRRAPRRARRRRRAR